MKCMRMFPLRSLPVHTAVHKGLVVHMTFQAAFAPTWSRMHAFRAVSAACVVGLCAGFIKVDPPSQHFIDESGRVM